MRLPGELVAGKALEELPCDGGLIFKFCEYGLGKEHGVFLSGVFRADQELNWCSSG
jgi:hypothetical protein